MTRTGDRPNYQLPNQRFDKGDAYRLTRLLEESATRFTGGMFGQTWGCLSAPRATLRTVVGPPTEVYIDIGACLFVRSSPDGFTNTIDNDTGPWDGKVVIHDPTRSAQATSSIDITAFAPTSYGGGGGVNGARAWLVFRRQESEVEVDDKAYWNTGAGTEATAPTNLVVQEYVEFAAVGTIPSGSSTYSEANGWYRFAYIAAWDDPAGPTIVPIHWVHAPYLQQETPPSYTGSQFAIAPTQATSLDSGGTRGFAPDLGMPSVSKLLHWMLAKLSQHYSTASIIDAAEGHFRQHDSGDGWMATPPRGLIELNQAALDLNQAMLNNYHAIQEGVAETNRLRADMLAEVRPVAIFTITRTAPLVYDVALVSPSSPAVSWALSTDSHLTQVAVRLVVTPFVGTTLYSHVVQVDNKPRDPHDAVENADALVASVEPSREYPVTGGSGLTQSLSIQVKGLTFDAAYFETVRVVFYGRRS